MDARLRLGTTQTLIDALAGARRVRLDAYLLRNPHLIGALERASDRGARVEVRLCGDPVGGAAVREGNRLVANRMREHGIRVESEPRYGHGALHDKIAIVDGRAFLDDRNWRVDPGETVVVDERPEDVRALRTGTGTARLPRTKEAALASEASLIARGSGDVFVATEAFGAGPVADAMLERARHGGRVRLLYAHKAKTSSANATLRELRAAGVRTRCSQANHKAACVGDRVWIGSANATQPRGGGAEWALTAGGKLAGEIRARLEHAWTAAR